MKEDRAVEYLLQFAVKENKAYQIPAALALREINDDRSFAALAKNVPQPTVKSQAPTDGPLKGRRVDLPIGPGGAIFSSVGEGRGRRPGSATLRTRIKPP